MEILKNQLLRWNITSETEEKIDRILWLDPSGTDIFTIDVVSPYAHPVLHKRSEIEAALLANKASFLDHDPYLQSHGFGETLTEGRRKFRDEAWEAVSIVVAGGDLVFDPHHRSQLIKKAIDATGRSEPTIRKDLRRYWQGGQTKNALIARFDGGKGKLKPSDGEKRGRKSLLSHATGKTLGVNVDDDIRNKFRRGIKLFYEKKNGIPLTKAYEKTLWRFFRKKIGLKNGRPVYELPLDTELPTFDQFKYWYEKERDIARMLQAREGKRRYNTRYRPVLGNSTLEAFGPGSIFQVDATIADIFLRGNLDSSLLIGRPTLYLVIDVFTRLICGFAATLDPPSWVGAMLALENTAMDKVEFCQSYDIEISEYEWPCKHLPEILVADRGEFESYKSNTLIDNLHMRVDNTAPYRADMKGIIERTFRWFNDEEIHWLPGAVDQIPERGERDYRLDGILSLDAFRELMVIFILDHNNNRELF